MEESRQAFPDQDERAEAEDERHEERASRGRPAGVASPLSQFTASGSIFHIFAARSLSWPITFSADCVTTMAEAKVTRLPPVRLL